MTDDPILKVLKQISPRSSGTGTGRKKNPAPAFAAEGQLPMQALAVSVSGVGALAQGLSPQQARALHTISSPAPFGKGEKTLLDARVRNTGEIAAEAVTLQWAGDALATLQAQAASALGLEGLQARLHKLLIYGPGQFFKPHQDTEKHPGMVGTLVLVWPSAHIGGELQVCKGEAMQPFVSQQLQAQTLRWCAFYADCRHEVKPVQEGWRVVLSFDLLLPAEAALAPQAAHPALVQALRALFDGGAAPRREPWLLLLDHEYTEHGLRWPLLKGQDREHVSALRAAAGALGLVPQLALTEIHQSWSASYAGSGRRGRDESDPEPEDLIDEDMSLSFWVDEQGRSHQGQAMSMSLAACASFTDDRKAFLVNEEYEGYMGNYGDTLDYWYRRAALVLQSPVAAEAARFATQPEAALADAVKLARTAGPHDALAQRLQRALPDLQRYARSKGRTVWARYAQLAAVVPPALATELCTPFEWQLFQAADAQALAKLGQAQGQDWLLALLRTWGQARAPQARWGWATLQAHNPDSSVQALWPQALPGFIGACKAAQLSAAVLDEMGVQAMNLLQLADKSPATPARRQATAQQRLQAVCELGQALQCLPLPPAVQQQLTLLLHHVAAQRLNYPLRQLVPLLQTLASPTAVALPERRALLGDVRAALQTALQQPLPAADDHGLREMDWTCLCQDCKPALAWAESATPQPLQLPLAAARRSHVQQSLQDAAAPLTFQLLKVGSPHRLVLNKQPGLHSLRQGQRASWVADLAALQLL